MNKNCFIYVVCGAKEHIDTLHFSLEFLKKYSKNEIWVLTDSSRNEIPVIHDKVVDVKTPDDMTHHQASIFLKTGIHHYFPKGNTYCYLDSDIITFSEEVDSIFQQYKAPISFAPDHCTMEQFSAYAMNCDCNKQYDLFRNKLDDELGKVDPLRWSNDQKIIQLRKELIAFYETNNSISDKIKIAIKYLLSGKTFNLTNTLSYHKSTKKWVEKSSGLVFMHKLNLAKSVRKIGLKWNFRGNFPMLKDGRNLWKNTCYHLPKAIEKKFHVKVDDLHFQHWNGGVFLFDDQSHDFLETWFQSTMEIFKDPEWKTRDQGTLIKTVWQLGLQNHPTLSKRWNLIADYHNPHLKWVDNTILLHPNEQYQPVLIHVYHHFGDENWSFWNKTIQLASR